LDNLAVEVDRLLHGVADKGAAAAAALASHRPRQCQGELARLALRIGLREQRLWLLTRIAEQQGSGVAALSEANAESQRSLRSLLSVCLLGQNGFVSSAERP
jgi:hypothetical protein